MKTNSENKLTSEKNSHYFLNCLDQAHSPGDIKDYDLRSYRIKTNVLV